MGTKVWVSSSSLNLSAQEAGPYLRPSSYCVTSRQGLITLHRLPLNSLCSQVIPGAGWLATLAESGSSCSVKDSASENKKESNQGRHPMCFGLHTMYTNLHTPVPTYADMCTPTYTYHICTRMYTTHVQNNKLTSKLRRNQYEGQTTMSISQLLASFTAHDIVA